MALPFVDTNLFLRHLLNDHPDHSPRATTYFRRIAQGEIQVRTSEIVIFEVVFTLERTYKKPKSEIRDSLLDLLAFPAIVLPGKQHFVRVFDYYINLNISFADAYHVVLMERLHLAEI